MKRKIYAGGGAFHTPRSSSRRRSPALHTRESANGTLVATARPMTLDSSGAVRAPPRRQRSLEEIIDREASRKRRRRALGWGLLAIAVAAALAAWLILRPRPVPLAARLRFEPVSHGGVLREVRATGHVEAVTTVQVGAEISGKIASVEVDYNARVTAGQV